MVWEFRNKLDRYNSIVVARYPPLLFTKQFDALNLDLTTAERLPRLAEGSAASSVGSCHRGYSRQEERRNKDVWGVDKKAI